MTNNATPPDVKKKFAFVGLVYNVETHIIKNPRFYNVSAQYTHIHTMKNRNKSGRSSLDREHKDVTCAVRLPKTMYDKLCQAAEMEESSLSDIIREGLIEKMDIVFKQHAEKELQQARLRAEVEELGLDPDKISGGALGALLRQETGS
jgi:hypothetical protein